MLVSNSSTIFRCSYTLLRDILRKCGYMVGEKFCDTANYDHIRLHSSGQRLERGYAYVADGKSWLEEAEALIASASDSQASDEEKISGDNFAAASVCSQLPDSGDCLLILTGIPAGGDLPFANQLNYLLLPEEADHYIVYEKLISCAMNIISWDNRLKDILYSGGSFLDLCTASYEFFGCPLTFHDENYVILARLGHRQALYPSQFYTSVGYRVYTSETLDAIMDDPVFVASLKTVGPQWWPVDGHPDSIYMNLWSNTGKWKGRIVLHPADDKPFYPSDLELVAHLTTYLIRLVPLRNNLIQQLNDSLERSLSAGLSGDLHLPAMPRILEEIMHWKREDTYLCLYLSSEKASTYADTNLTSNICADIIDILPETRAFIHDDGIAVVINQSRSGLTVSDIRMHLATLIRETLMTIGISLPFKDLTLLPLYYLQAYEALSLRDAEDTNWFADFANFTLQYLLQKAKKSRLTPGIYSEGLKRLFEYDKTNGTELADTLEFYLEHDRSIKECSVHFGINRTTVTYRLERIEKITMIDFEDPDQRMLVMLLFRLRKPDTNINLP